MYSINSLSHSILLRSPTAYIICGFIGSGKTTFARKLEEKTGAIRITKDEWMVRIFGNKIPSDNNFERYDNNVTKLATDIAFKILKAGKDVIIDEGFWVKSQRDELKIRIKEIGAKSILYYVICPTEVMRERTLKRNDQFSEFSFHITEDMFNNYLKYWEPPTEEENYKLAY